MTVHARRAITAATLIAIGAIAASVATGPADVAPAEILPGLFGLGEDATVTIVRDIRLPRALAAFFAGAALGLAGAALQGLLRNPLADPGVLGVSGASALGAVVAIYFNLTALGAFIVPVFAVTGAGAAVAALFVLGAGKVSSARLVLVGVGLSSLAGSLIALVMNLAPNPFVLSDLVTWLFGSVANRSFDDIALAAPVMGIGAALVLAAGSGLRALSLGEEAAESVGVNLVHIRLLTIAGSALLVGGSVALAGIIGFVGVVAPHLARPLVGHDPARALLPSALIAGAALAGADLMIRLLPFSQELKLGIAAALIGAPGFVIIAARTRRLAR